MALAPDSVELFCLSLSLWTQYGRCSKFQVCLDCLHNLYVYRLLGLTKALTVIVLTILLWYAGFAVCYLIVKIPVWYKVLAALAAILANLFIGFLLLVVLMKIGEMLDA